MNGTLGTVESLERVGSTDEHKIRVRVDKGSRSVEFSTKDYSDITYGYAATIHKTQGATADRSTILASKYMDRHATYVAMSRHVHQADMYYSAADFESFDKLKGALSREARKDMALDYLERPMKAERPAPTHIQADRNERSERPRPAQAILDRFAAKPKKVQSPADRLARAKASIAAEKLRDALGERPDVDRGPEFGPGV